MRLGGFTLKRSVSLRTYLAISFGILMIVMTGILSLLIGNKSIEEVKSEIGDSLADTAYQMADKMDAYMWSRSGEIYTLSQLEALHNFEEPASIQKLLDQLKLNFPSFAWIGLMDETGTVIASTDGILKGVDISERPVFMEGIKGKFIGDVHEAVLLAKLLPNPTGEAMKFVDVSIPIISDGGSVKGVLAAHLSWTWAKEVEKSVLEPLKDRENTEMFVVSSKDNVILLGKEDMIGTKLGIDGMNSIKEKKNFWAIETWDDGKEYLTGYALENGYMNYEGLGWTIVVRKPLQLAYRNVWELQIFIIIVGCSLALLFSIAIWFFAGKISKPIYRISKAAENIRLGQQVQIPQIVGIKEIEELSLSLRELLSNLMRSETALDRMESVAHHDHLTGLPNRTGLERYLENAIHVTGIKDKVLTILCLDLDGFKGVNDTYGHNVGDILLQSVAEKLLKVIREDEIAARLGGDEFIIVLNTNLDNATQVGKQVANRIIEELNSPFMIDNQVIKIGCSVGIAMCNQNNDINNALKLADEALYNSKCGGKNRATVYNR
jgi:diguanylate cyclase (GGDEF)-like protein